MVLLSLLWWKQAAPSDDMGWSAAVSDIKWVLQAMLQWVFTELSSADEDSAVLDGTATRKRGAPRPKTAPRTATNIQEADPAAAGAVGSKTAPRAKVNAKVAAADTSATSSKTSSRTKASNATTDTDAVVPVTRAKRVDVAGPNSMGAGTAAADSPEGSAPRKVVPRMRHNEQADKAGPRRSARRTGI